MVGDFLDADMHTLTDGALSRYLKMRKWLVLTASSLVLLQTGLLDFQRLADALFVSGLQADQFHWFLSVAGVWQLVMLLLILSQVINGYPQSLRTRRDLKPEETLWNTRTLKWRRNEIMGENGIPESVIADPNFASDPGRDKLVRRVREIDKLIPHHNRLQWFVLIPEVVIDAMRLLPTVAFFVYALVVDGAWAAPLTP